MLCYVNTMSAAAPTATAYAAVTAITVAAEAAKATLLLQSTCGRDDRQTFTAAILPKHVAGSDEALRLKLLVYRRN